MLRALKETHVTGLSTNRDFLVGLVDSALFRENTLHTRLLDLEIRELLSSMERRRGGHAPETLLAAAGYISLSHSKESGGGALGDRGAGKTGSPWEQIGYWRIVPGITLMWEEQPYYITYRSGKENREMWLRVNGQEMHVALEQRRGHQYRIRVNGRLMKMWGIRDHSEIHLDVDGHRFDFRRLDIPDRRYIPRDEKQKQHATGEISAPLNGRVVQVHVKEGDHVTEGEPLLVIESMKMENKMLSDHEAIVRQIEVSVGQQVRTNQLLLTLGSI